MRQAERVRGRCLTSSPVRATAHADCPASPSPFRASLIADALRRSSPLPPGEGDLVRVHEPERLRPLAQEAVDEGGLPGPVRTGEEDEGGN